MKVLLKPDWETKVSIIKPRVYSLGNKNWQVVDKIFNEMHRLDYLKFTTKYTPFSFPVFVIWKPDAKGKRKSRVVVDIRKLNEMLLSDSYPLPL